MDRNRHPPFRCQWPLLDGNKVRSPRFPPLGVHEYILLSETAEGVEKIAKRLTDEFGDSRHLSELRELKLVKMITARLSDQAVRWLCEQSDLDDHISAVELDQAVHSVELEPAVSVS